MAVQHQSSAKLVFGPFELDPAAGELRRNGVRVRLSGQPFRILLLLLAHPAELVTREQLREEIWTAATFVDFEHGLNAAVNKLRRALGDAAGNPRYIETQPGRGYRFIGRVESQRSAPIASVAKSPIHENPPAKRKVRFWWWLAAAGAGLAFIVLGGVMIWSLVGRGSPHRPKLTDKSTIVLADFWNATGDPVFDGTLRQGLTIQLEQSPFLKIMDDEETQRVLSLMSLPPSTRITNAIAHEICIREGSTATIDGAIASFGKPTSSHFRQSPVTMAQRSPGCRSRPKIKSMY